MVIADHQPSRCRYIRLHHPSRRSRMILSGGAGRIPCRIFSHFEFAQRRPALAYPRRKDTVRSGRSPGFSALVNQRPNAPSSKLVSPRPAPIKFKANVGIRVPAEAARPREPICAIAGCAIRARYAVALVCLRSSQRARSGGEDDSESKCNFGEHGLFLLVGWLHDC
jgi:hypothetical protein